MSKLHLKVKVKCLAAEAVIIRHEEKKALARHLRKFDRHPTEIERGYCAEAEDLRLHRWRVVSVEARTSQLAYGFLRGRPYAVLENRVWPGCPPDLDRVASMAARFGGSAFDKAAWDAWLGAALAHLDSRRKLRRPSPLLRSRFMRRSSWWDRWRIYRSEDGAWNFSIFGDPEWRFLVSLGPTLRDSGWSYVRKGRPARWGGLWTRLERP